MDVFNFCWLTLLDESKKCSVFFDKNTCNVRNDINENFNKPLNRISYLYKFGCYNICFFHQCFRDFFLNTPNSSRIIDNFRSLNNLNILSMSTGPGTDIIGLLYSLHHFNKPLINPAVFKVISKHGSWRNLVTEMIKSSIINVPDESYCKLIECDFLKELSKKAEGYLKAADILLMCDSFSSSLTTEKEISHTLQTVIHLLKPGALVFFIDCKEKSTYFKEINSAGIFLYGPVEAILENMPYNKKIAELVGVQPLCSGRSLFAVWQKLDEINFQIENSLIVGSNYSSATLIRNMSDVKDINAPIHSIFNLKKELSSDTNISSNESVSSSSQFSSSSISSKNIRKKEKKLIVSNPVQSFNGDNIDFPASNFNFVKNKSPASVNATDLLLENKYAPQCGSGFPKIESGNSMDSLLKNFESLTSKLEELIDSRDSLKLSNVKDKKSLSVQQCNQIGHQEHHRCSVKPCQFKEDDSTCCCHSMVCSTNVASNLYRILPQEGPCIVIPLQNLSSESLTHILSIVSQNFPSESTSFTNERK